MSIESVMPSNHLIPCRPLLGVSCSIGVGQRDLNKKGTGILSSMEVTGWRKGLEGSRDRIRTGMRQVLGRAAWEGRRSRIWGKLGILEIKECFEGEDVLGSNGGNWKSLESPMRKRVIFGTPRS